jgi:inorganic pyrophosphatase
MDISKIGAGKNMPNDFNVVIEISANAAPVKYEFDKEAGAIFVDRFMSTAMFYPTNYGFVPNTLSGDGDPVDVLVMTPHPLPPGVVVRCRALGMLKMEDEAGVDGKIIAVPVEKLCPMYKNIQTLEDIPLLLKEQISHFFEHYKDLEKGKWVKVTGWVGVEGATEELVSGVANYKG